MLKYLVAVTEALISFAIITGMLLAYGQGKYGQRGRRSLFIATWAGLAAAVVMAILKNKTKLISTPAWNLRIFGVSLIAYVLLMALDRREVRRKWQEVTVCVLLALLLFGVLFYALPDVIAYPYTFVLGGEVVLSTGFLYRLIGMVAGLILVVVAMLAVYQGSTRITTAGLGVVLKLELTINALWQGSKMIQILNSRRLLVGHGWFMIARYSANHASLFIYASIAVALIIPVLLLIRSGRVDEPYENPAQHRLIRAKWRNIRRWAVAALLCYLISILNMTVVKAYDSKEVSLSPVEDALIRDGAVWVSFEQVADGHLHRFAYVTEEGTQIRFIVIQKPNSSAYGVGMDACEICGETGYYEKDGQVVCKLCDVVMNINTIGFKGGCNPLVVNYRIEDGNIVVPIDALLEYESEFK